jgi:hypothetical protein
MIGQPMTSLRAILSRFTKRTVAQGQDNLAQVPPIFFRIGSKVGYFISVSCELFIGGIKLFIVYPIGVLVFCALGVAALNDDEAPDVTIVSGIYESVLSSLEGAPAGQMNLFKCDDPAVTIEMANQACQNRIVKTVPLSEGIPVLAAQLTDVFRLFYAMAVLVVFAYMFIVSRSGSRMLVGAVAKYPMHAGALVGASAMRSELHKSGTPTENAAMGAEPGSHTVDPPRV